MVPSRKRPPSLLPSSPCISAASASLLLHLILMIAGRATQVVGQQQTVCADSAGSVAPLCRCTVSDGTKTVDCSELGLMNVPGSIPDDTNILNLSDNLIEGLASRVFANLVDLRELYLVQNSIRNDLLDAGAFFGLTRLRLLDLTGNRLQLQDESNVQPFLPLVRLRHLDLGYNNIATIDRSFVTVLDRLRNLFMVGNPLVCDCNLIWFKNWLLNKGTQPDFSALGVQCFTPESVRRETVENARFCIPVQRCYFCNSASTNAACNFAQQQCSGTNPACRNEVRIVNGMYLIGKACQALDACLVNAEQNQNDCNAGTENSVCRYCCQGDRCNAPESAILSGYQFPFPNTSPTAQSTTLDLSTTTQTPSTTTQTPSTTTQAPPTTTQIQSTTTQTPSTTTQTPSTTTQAVTPTDQIPTSAQLPPTLEYTPPIALHPAPLREEVTCEGDDFFISCSSGSTIDVQWALYGREDQSQVCRTYRARPCGDPATSLAVIQEFCQGEERCGFPVSNSQVGGDPCPNVAKYLVVRYSCIGEATRPPIRRTTMAASTKSTPVVRTNRPVLSRCPAEETRGETGTFEWPETLAGDIAILPCAYDLKVESATRQCGDSSSSWNDPNTSECPTASAILKALSNVTIMRENALEVSFTLTDVTSVPDVLRPNDVANAVNTFENLADAINSYGEDSPDVFGNIVDTVDQLTGVPDNQLVESQLNDDSSSRLLRSIDAFNLGVQFPSNVLEEDTPSVDVVLVDITDPMDNGLLFYGSGKDLGNAQPKVTSDSTGNADTVVANNSSTDEIVKGSIFLPNSLLTSVGNRLSRVQFVMYEETTFFDVIQAASRNRTLSNKHENEANTIPTTDSVRTTASAMANSTIGSTAPPADCIAVSCREDYKTIINSVIISAAVGDLNITNLDEPATITFRKARMDADNPRCVFWDETNNDGWGGWSTEGCSLDSGNDIDDSNVVCKCNHLTNFAMLMDIYDGPPIPPGHQLALSIISYIGCTLSLIGLTLTLITYTCCGSKSRAKVNDKKFTGDKRAKVLVNFVISLILVNVFFIAGSLMAEYQESVPDELCAAVAICLHFSLLVAMAWMVIQAFNMYMALVKVFATYYSHFLLKMMIIGWGIPLAIVGTTIGVDLQNYGSSSGLCWLSGLSFYISFLLPVCLVLVFNIVVFVAVTWKLCRLRRSKISTSDRFNVAAQLRATVSVTILLGLTWILGFFAIGAASLTFSYLFAAFNSLQGFAVFVFQCLLQREMRQRWVQACCPNCAPETGDTKSGVYSTSRNQTTRTPNNNWSKGTTNTTTAGTSCIDNPAYEGVSQR
ncbi:adhesion G-protein coupled receptor G2-like isoform X2 [Patiria miniata]|uniref:Uncharacterized protein n=1 Tax=Patiria miniata TaxID=46514 RepID=A0A914A530_PATMI|nr:adhesion G-protein coupled receptor G2-like isoform X2 [Patiria miniata]XP_038058913.1 adhesion G-protein coupled receptor G2-like isoform X2 [Patiria miniata]